MNRCIVMVVFLASGLCSPPDALTATVDAVATQNARLGSPVDLVLKVTNTGPVISHLGFVFRGADRWYDRHEMTDLGGCSISNEASAFDCGDLATDESKTYSFRGIANVAGTFHFELALRELVHPFDFVNDHSDGAAAH